MKRVVLVFVAITLLVSLILAGCAPKGEPRAGWPAAVSITTTRAGTSGNLTGVSLADLITKQLGVSAAAEPTTSTLELFTLCSTGKSELACGTSTFDDVFGYLAQKEPYDYSAAVRGNMRRLYFVYTSVVHVVVRADSDIYTFADLRGKRVRLDAPSITQTAYNESVFAAFGMKWPDDVIAMPRGTLAESTTALREKTADAICTHGAPPVAGIAELADQIPIRLLPIPPDKAKIAIEKAPGYVAASFPAGSYKGVDTDVPGLAQYSGVSTRVDMDDDFVYNVVKTTFEHLDDLKAAYQATWKQLSLESAFRVILMPSHAGAIKYYKEQGVWTKEMDDKNKELLAKADQKK